MAFRDITRGIKNFFGSNNRFFNGAREEENGADDAFYPQNGASSYPPESAFAQPPYQQPAQDAYYAQQQQQQAPYQPGYAPQQAYQQPQPAYAQGYPPQQQQQYRTQAGYQQPQQNAGYQQPQQQPQNTGFQQQTVNQPYVPPRNRRAAQHSQPRENVVPFPGAVGAQQPQPSQPAAAPQQEAPTEQKKPSACVINVRNFSDCRSAIGILRAGDCVVAVIDSIADQAEVRRYVDTLNGACFSLGCTMTRTSSRVGVYFLAPQGMQVLTDQTTTQMNAQSRAPQRARSAQPVFQTAYTQRPAYTANPYAAPQAAAYGQQPQYAAPQQPVFTQQPQQGFTAQEPAAGFTPEQDTEDYAQDAVN